MRIRYKFFSKLFTLIIPALLIFLCSPSISYAIKNDGKNKAKYLLDMASFVDFTSIQGAPLSDKFSDVFSVKVVYDIIGGKLYFTNSAYFRYHYQFCDDVLDDHDPLDVFNQLNYGNTVQRKYILANINYYEESHIYALEFVSEDQVSAQAVNSFFKLIQSKSYLKDSLHLLVGSDNFKNGQ